MITAVLIVHILLAVTVSVGFILRYILVFKDKAYPKNGQKPLLAGSAMLVVSGVALALLAKLPVTSLCLESLGIITALIALEVGLQVMSTKLAKERIRINKD